MNSIATAVPNGMRSSADRKVVVTRPVVTPSAIDQAGTRSTGLDRPLGARAPPLPRVRRAGATSVERSAMGTLGADTRLEHGQGEPGRMVGGVAIAMGDIAG